MDALTHALEAYVCNCGNPLSDQLAIDATRKIFNNLENAVAGDIEARNEMLFASTTAGLAFGNADVGAVHCLSESIGGTSSYESFIKFDTIDIHFLRNKNLLVSTYVTVFFKGVKRAFSFFFVKINKNKK